MAKNHSFKSDFIGRIANMTLAPSAQNALTPLFEAINNSIQAIEDKFGKDNLTKGKIKIEVLRNDGPDGKPTGFVIRDNGAGFNGENFASFLTADTRHKLTRGGRGVGRFLWLKVFERAKIESTYEDQGVLHGLTFEFILSEQNQIRNVTETSPQRKSKTGTVVTLEPMLEDYSAHCPSKPSTIKSKIIGHFVSYFVNMHLPKIFYVDGGEAEELFDVFSASIERDKISRLRSPKEIGSTNFVFTHFCCRRRFLMMRKGVMPFSMALTIALYRGSLLIMR